MFGYESDLLNKKAHNILHKLIPRSTLLRVSVEYLVLIFHDFQASQFLSVNAFITVKYHSLQ